jgi:hypothetical protein
MRSQVASACQARGRGFEFPPPRPFLRSMVEVRSFVALCGTTSEVRTRSLGLLSLGLAIALAGCGRAERSASDGPYEVAGEASAPSPLRIRTLRGSVAQMGSIRGEQLYGVRLVAHVCSRSPREADRTYPTSFRIAHYVPTSRTAVKWGQPFRILVNDLYWLVPLGETSGVCRDVEFEDVIPPDNYGGLESALGVLGHTRACYAVQLTLRAILDRAGDAMSTTISASKRAIIQCRRRFGPS